MNKILETAKKYIGYKEDPPDSNMTIFGEWFGLNGEPWCGIFASFIYYHAGYPLESIGFEKGFASCQLAVEHFSKTGQVTDNPQPGDLVFYDWKNDGHFDHCGIFDGWANSFNDHLNAIEGNTSKGNDSNGGEVMARFRWLFKGVLFVHPRVLDKDTNEANKS